VPNRIRVLIADDHASVRENLRYLVDAEGDMECVGVAKDGLRCVDLCHELAPQVVVLDGDMPGVDGLRVLRHLVRELPDIQIVMYTVESEICEVARWQGAFACVLKDAPYEILIAAIRRAAYAPVGSETF
jgi:DNA-binding NarL/FixJ family response regulator